jgi:hypothetical protein
MMMKQLLIEEMKRAIEIMDSKPSVLSRKKLVGPWVEQDRDITELRQLLLAIRKHSIMLEKGIK